MKKFIFTLAIAMMAFISVNAQTATEDSKVLDNTYVGAEACVSTPLNFNSLFPVNPAVGVKLGKEITPVFGLEVEGFAVLGDNFYRYGVNNSTLVPLEGAMNIIRMVQLIHLLKLLMLV